MKVVGIIAEYNPLHNGHVYHLETAKQMAETDLSLCVMSGNFVQRGEPALVNKWARARMALEAGVDLVLELPAAYATASAPNFARGAVRTLAAAGVVTHICFGSELGRLEPLAGLADLLAREPGELRDLLRKHLRKGLGFARARSLALGEYAAKDWAEAIAKPNNLLAVEYLRALKNLGAGITPLTFPRRESMYADKLLPGTGQIASASAIRSALQSGSFTDAEPFVPKAAWQILREEFAAGRGPIFAEELAPFLLMKLRTGQPDELAEIPDVSEGLENRIWQAARQACTYQGLVDGAASKRYPRTRIQRILIHYLLGWNRELADPAAAEDPGYLRVLGFGPRGRLLLRHMRRQAVWPVLTKIGGQTPSKVLALDLLATDVYNLLYPRPDARRCGQDYRCPPIRV